MEGILVFFGGGLIDWASRFWLATKFLYYFILLFLCICMVQATIPGILCGPLTAELVTTSHGRWFPVFVLAGGVNFTAAVIYISQSSAAQVL